MKPSRLPSAFGHLFRTAAAAPQPLQTRCLHRQAEYVPKIPTPTPFCPDVASFLKLIGRGLSQHTAKFTTWEALFSLTSPQLKELGIEPPRTRRYLIQWREKYKSGHFGPGGDIKHVQDGKAKLAVEEIEKGPLEVVRRVVNIPFDKDLKEVSEADKVRVDGYSAEGKAVSGPYALPLKGTKSAIVAVTEGMWEEKRGRKIDGGERRRAEVRFKRRVAERRAQREAMGFS
ncbi:IGR protein motif-domain-containing protein [Coniella lustricola]|uniref:Small ribosomal subunit protein mS41 n=1 Tax=Coniella lustricola TaxID=2025994 RepID=A0A2T2ZXS1_9PEZI|nr:IGR protein motif-domain-containing protein [Coniella lustricola]